MSIRISEQRGFTEEEQVERPIEISWWQAKLGPMPLSKFALLLVFVASIVGIGSFLSSGSAGFAVLCAIMAAIVLQVGYFILILLQVATKTGKIRTGRSERAIKEPLYPLAKRRPEV